VAAQRALHSVSLDAGPINGIFGPKTASAVAGFQKMRKLQATGVIDSHTWRLLGETTPEGRQFLALEFSGDLDQVTPDPDVEAAQAALGNAGFPTEEINGIYGPSTMRAVREFQKARGLPVDGVVGPVT
jgi:peptidoglycan hydrolase-like protein with peptidoglycan-binding domain